jgi:hypothetical protein
MPRDHSGYLRRVGYFYSVWGLLPTTWQLSVTGAVSAVTAYLGFQYGGLFYALIGAVFVFTLGTIVVFFLMLIARNIGVFGKLAVREIGITSFTAETKSKSVSDIRYLTMNFLIGNNSQRDIHFKLERADHSVLGQINQGAVASVMTHIVPSFQQQLLLFATIDKISLPKIDPNTPSPITGKIRLDIKYGPAGNAMGYLLRYEADLSFGIAVTPNADKNSFSQVHLSILPMVKVYDHRRVGVSPES